METSEKEEFRSLIAECIDDALEKKHGELWVDAKKHYNDHQRLDYCAAHWDEMQANHIYISDLRGLGRNVKSWTLKTTITILVSTTIAWIAYHLFGAAPNLDVPIKPIG